MALDFTYDQDHHVHVHRAREIFAKYPQVRDLMRPNPATALWAVALVSVQWAAGYALTSVSWIWVFVAEKEKERTKIQKKKEGAKKRDERGEGGGKKHTEEKTKDKKKKTKKQRLRRKEDKR